VIDTRLPKCVSFFGGIHDAAYEHGYENCIISRFHIDKRPTHSETKRELLILVGSSKTVPDEVVQAFSAEVEPDG